MRELWVDIKSEWRGLVEQPYDAYKELTGMTIIALIALVGVWVVIWTFVLWPWLLLPVAVIAAPNAALALARKRYRS